MALDDDDFKIITPPETGRPSAGAAADDDFKIIEGGARQPDPYGLDQGIAQRAQREAPGKERTLGEALTEGAHNFIPSAKRNIGAMADVVTHPGDTLHAFRQLGAGVMSKAEGALGANQDPAKKAEDEKIVNALVDHYKDVYGSKQGLYNEIAKDPTSVLMDISPAMSGGLGAAARAAGTTTKIGRALDVAKHFTDPVSATMYGAGKAMSGVNAIGKAAASKTAGVPKSVLDIAQSAGAESDPAMREVFTRHLTGDGDAREVLDTAQDALGKARDQFSQEYANSAAGHSASQAGVTPRALGNIRRSVSDVQNSINGPGRITGALKKRNDMLDEISTMVDEFSNDPRYHNYEGLDWLKRAIRDKQYEYGFAGHTPGGHDASSIANAIKAEIEGIAPGYNNTMEKWEGALDQIRDLTAGLSIGNNADSTKAVAKMMKQMQTENGQHLLSQLDQHRPDLKYMLAGHTLHPWSHGGLRGLLDLLISAGGANALATPGPFAWLAASSPRAMGTAQYGIGSLSRAVRTAPAQVGKYGAMELSHIEPQDAPAPDAQTPTARTPSTAEDAPRGVRNNNRGNIKDGEFAQSQPGYSGADQDGFARFEHPEDGEAAGKRLLRSYIDRGHNTIEKIARRWSPDPKEYPGKIRAMAQAVGINPNVRLDRRAIDSLWDALTTTEVGRGHAAGGRIARASGGRTLNLAGEAEKLVGLVDRRLKHQNTTTEPLLEMHDDAVTKALRAADKHI